MGSVEFSPGKQDSITQNNDLRRKMLSLWIYPSSSFFPQIYMHIPYGVGHVFSHLGSAVRAVSSPLPNPQPPHWWGQARRPHFYGAVLSNNKNHPALINTIPAQIQNTGPYQGPWRKLSQPKPAQRQRCDFQVGYKSISVQKSNIRCLALLWFT